MSDFIPAITTVDVANQVLTWNSDGYYMVGDDNWQDVVFETSIKYNGGAIGIAPRVYENNMYMTFKLTNTSDELGVTGGYAELDAQVTYDKIRISDKVIGALVVGQVYSIKAEITGTNYKIYLDNVLVFNIEYSSMARGRVGIYSSAGNTCSSIEVKSIFPDSWTSNASTVLGGVVDIRELDNEDRYLYLSKTSGSSTLYAEQKLNVVGGSNHTLSFNSEGTGGVAYIIEANGAAPVSHQLTIPAGAWTRYEVTKAIKADCTEVIIRFSVVTTELKINAVQLEKNNFSTGYIHNMDIANAGVRQDSVITFPSKENIEPKKGSVSMFVKPSINHDGTTLRPVLFEYGDVNGVIRIDYSGTGIRFKYGTSETVTLATPFQAEVWYHIVATWNQAGISLYVNDVVTSKTINYELTNQVDLIRIGHGYTANTVFFGAVDEVIVYNNPISKELVNELFTATEQIPDSTAMIMRGTFNHAIGNFNKSHIEMTPAPQYGSPVIVEKQNGTPLNKVSFFNPVTGDYRTYNEEEVYYDGKSDYIVVSYNTMDEENFAINIRDFDDVQYGAPYTVDGYRIYLSLTNDEKAFLAGKKLIASYQLEDAFTVDYNIGMPDSFRVNIGKYDGEPVKVHYEGNDFHTEKLATMVELNPLLNPNHEGFLYITNNVEKVTSFRAKATPDSLPANGVAEAILIVEPMDSNGNFISHLELEVKAEKGTILPAYDKQSILLRDRAGRYIYRYTAPLLHFAKQGVLQEDDRVNIIDKETGLGVQIPLTLSTLTMVNHKIIAGDTIASISDDYGADELDITTENNLSLATVDAYLKASVGAFIKVPMNYSSRLVAKTKQEKSDESMIAVLLDKVLKYFNQKANQLPSGLGTILDFNQDGLISIEEVVWLNEKKLTDSIRQKYASLKQWENNNAG